MRTTEDYRFYTASASFPEFSNKDKPLIVQYSVKHEQNIDCGGAYVKLYPAGTDQAHLHGDSKYKYVTFDFPRPSTPLHDALHVSLALLNS